MKNANNLNEGRLVESKGPLFTNRVFFTDGVSRHWVTSLEWIIENDFNWPNDVHEISDSELIKLSPARPTSREWKLPLENDIESQLQLREIGASFLRGSGVEFGAASNPLPIPLRCKVDYADMLSYDELLATLYPGQHSYDMIKPSIKAKLDNLHNLEKEYDFIAAAHVIEHVRNPIGAILGAADKIKVGGHLLLFVPDMERTFDCKRELTTIEHLMLDFYSPDRNRDKEHYQEFYRLTGMVSADNYEVAWKKSYEEEFPIHYHTWTYKSFKIMAEVLITTFGAFNSYWSHQTVGNEFCFVFEK